MQHLMHEALERIEVAVAQAQDLRDDLCAVRDDLRAAIERLAAERGAQ